MINKVTLIGNLGQDVKLITFEGGNMIGTTSLATSKSWKDKTTGDKKERTEWHKLVFRGKAAEIVEKYTEKGQKLYVEGEIQYREYEKDGVKKYITEISVNDFKFLSHKDESPSQKTPAKDIKEEEHDDIPF